MLILPEYGVCLYVFDDNCRGPGIIYDVLFLSPSNILRLRNIVGLVVLNIFQPTRSGG